MNELLWIGFALLDLTMVLIVYRLFGRVGLFGIVVFNLLLCNLQVLKTVEMFGLTTTLGNILYASVFLATDMLSELHGKDEAKKAVLMGFVSLLMMTAYMQLALLFVPGAEDFAHPHLEALFGFMPRIALASLAAYLVSQLHDVWAFHKLKQRTGGKHLWLRNNASTLVSQFLDSAIFCTIAFYGLFPTAVFTEILISTYVIKLAVALLDTPFMYIAKRMFPQQAKAA
ncbi:queuosine precursor transporter [Salidesulfovibrio brasiliensis]|uniref:queuosine precursor transporter n=1 Tax=Salidesulfovibrio brasiliensis TaxID=221711 RepID=UPI0006D2BFD3|nr:queuosine precursor transporter [Salidesulfovibrio brasiliensis]